MSRRSARLLYWSPRILTMAFAVFLGLFAVDVFRENQVRGVAATLAAFALHLGPAAIVVVVLLIAWRWEWIGAALFACLACAYVWMVVPRHVDWALTVASPLLLIAALFLANRRERAQLRATLPPAAHP